MVKKDEVQDKVDVPKQEAPKPKKKEYPGGVSEEYYNKFLGDRRVQQPGPGGELLTRKWGQAFWGDDPDEWVRVVFHIGSDGDNSDVTVAKPDHRLGSEYWQCPRNQEQPLLRRALYAMDNGKHHSWVQKKDSGGNPIGAPEKVISKKFPYEIVGPYDPNEEEKS